MTSVEKTILARGRTAEVFSWPDQQVLKLFHDWMPAELIECEIQAARLVSDFGLPTPKLLGELWLDGRRGLVYERVMGETLLSLLGKRPWCCVRYARQFANLHAAIHLQRGIGLPPLKASLAHNLRSMEGQPATLIAATLDRLAQLPDGESLCHFDFHPDQVLMTSNGLVVLDWMAARSGPPAADVARTTLLICFGPLLEAGWWMRQLANLLRGIFQRAYLQRYLELNPAVNAAAIEAWLPVVAMDRLAEGIPGETKKLQELVRKQKTSRRFP